MTPTRGGGKAACSFFSDEHPPTSIRPNNAQADSSNEKGVPDSGFIRRSLFFVWKAHDARSALTRRRSFVYS